MGLPFCATWVVLVTIYALLVGVKATAPSDSVVVFAKGEGGYYCHKIPYLLRTQANTLIALAEGRGRDGRSACDDFSGTDLVLKRSTDSGLTWSSLGLLYSNSSATETNVIGNAAPVQDALTGRIWMPFCRNNYEVYITFSDDDGVTWAPPQYQPTLTHKDWEWIGLGPPGGLQLASGRLLIPAYHTIKWKGDGCVSHGHTIYSDDHGLTWQLGSVDFGAPNLANECQAVQLGNGSVLINARTLLNHRVQVISNDGGLTFGAPTIPSTLVQPLEGCEGSIVRDKDSGILYFSDPTSTSVTRLNMKIFSSKDDGTTWEEFVTVDDGAVAYSSLQIIPSAVNQGLATRQEMAPAKSGLEILYERSNVVQLVFEPDEIRYWRVF